LLIGPGRWMRTYSLSGKQRTTGSAVGIYCRFGQRMLAVTAQSGQLGCDENWPNADMSLADPKRTFWLCRKLAASRPRQDPMIRRKGWSCKGEEEERIG
jgi:hypothetical protein